MMLLWILFGMIITLDIAVYGLYRMLTKRPAVGKPVETLAEITKLLTDSVRKLDFKLMELEKKVNKKERMKEKQKRGRPRTNMEKQKKSVT